jgi:hypothetical protein
MEPGKEKGSNNMFIAHIALLLRNKTHYGYKSEHIKVTFLLFLRYKNLKYSQIKDFSHCE